MIGLKYLYAMLAGAFSGQPALNLRGRRPTGSQLRNPADEYQSDAIEAAKLKRYRKARKLEKHAISHSRANHTHQIAVNDLVFNPFYVAK